MEESVLELITHALMEDRISEALEENEEYQRAKSEEDRLFDMLVNDLTAEQKKGLDDLYEATTWTATLWGKCAYQQGMKDFLALMKDLSEK